MRSMTHIMGSQLGQPTLKNQHEAAISTSTGRPIDMRAVVVACLPTCYHLSHIDEKSHSERTTTSHIYMLPSLTEGSRTAGESMRLSCGSPPNSFMKSSTDISSSGWAPA